MPELRDFIGNWRLTRRIEDRLAGTTARFDGRATFAPVPGGLVQEDAGRLRLPGRSAMTATRRYLWRAEGHRLVVRFADGGAFHDFDATDPQPAARHPCGEDHYQVAYDFRAWPDWRAVWHVTGPRKDYTLVSDFACATAGAGAEPTHHGMTE